MPLPPGGHVFQPNGTIFELVQDIIGIHVLLKFYEDQTINVTSRVLTRFYFSHIRKTSTPPGGHVYQQIRTIFKLIQDIIRTDVLIKFHEDWTINVTCRMLTKFYLSHIRKTATPPGGRVFQQTRTIFEIIQDIIRTKFSY